MTSDYSEILKFVKALESNKSEFPSSFPTNFPIDTYEIAFNSQNEGHRLLKEKLREGECTEAKEVIRNRKAMLAAYNSLSSQYPSFQTWLAKTAWQQFWTNLRFQARIALRNYEASYQTICRDIDALEQSFDSLRMQR